MAMKSKPMSDPVAAQAVGGAGADLRVLLAQAGDFYWETDARHRVTTARSMPHASLAAALARPEAPALTAWLQQWPGQPWWEIPAQPVEPSAWEQQRAILDAHAPFANLVVRNDPPAAPPAGAPAPPLAHPDPPAPAPLWLPLWLQLCGAPVRGADGASAGYVGIGRDVTQLHQARGAVRQLASVDALTQLLNRETFDERAQQALANAYALGRQCALLCIGLDRLQQLNSIHGRRIGDRMLVAVAARLANLVRAPNLLARRGGDEIVALLVDVGGTEAATGMAQQLIDAVAPAERLDNLEVSVRASVGVGLFPKDGGDLDELLNAGEAALVRARADGGSTGALFTGALARRTDLRVRLEQRLRKAYESRDFKLYYQPLVSL